MKFLGLLVVSLCLAATALGQSAFSTNSLSQTVQNALGANSIGQNTLAASSNAVNNAVNSVVGNTNSAASWNIPANSQFNTVNGNGIFQSPPQSIQTGNMFENSIGGSGMQNQVLFNSASSPQGIPVNTMSMPNQQVPNFNAQFPMGGEVYLNGGHAGAQTFNSIPTFTSAQAFNSQPLFQNAPVFNGVQAFNSQPLFQNVPTFTGGQAFNSIPFPVTGGQAFNNMPFPGGQTFSTFTGGPEYNNVPYSPAFLNSAPPLYDAIPAANAFPSPVYDQMQYAGFNAGIMDNFSGAYNSMLSTAPQGLATGQQVYCVPYPNGGLTQTQGKK
ncbi:uncharacterized protein LOC110450584 [Mizuhopecten yessoensis]|uniref:uncharacterized protein LOC110450584 n=1 Tax=Mizuhopecten yessoensis TaxID=6573 RepID=UPI000B4582F5|nr:uncharacterized protein LOC110450584 [Mizuhopecten yessoensis]XP_021353858.1 uncharacterized protein LOC110450584 [Mizuhopecten yessoensis]